MDDLPQSKSDTSAPSSFGARSPVLVVDLEATCDEGNRMPADQMEIIEIGAVWATRGGRILDEFQAFVRPVLHPRLTDFCRQLTGIRQVDVDAAALFPEVAVKLARFAELHRAASLGAPIWGSWGRYDARQFERDCARHAAPHPMPGFEHVNLKSGFARSRRIKEVGMSRALQMAGLQLEGKHHRGLDDARNIARLLPFVDPAFFCAG